MLLIGSGLWKCSAPRGERLCEEGRIGTLFFRSKSGNHGAVPAASLSFTSVTSITLFSTFLFPDGVKISLHPYSCGSTLSGEADVFGLARLVWVVRAEIWVRKSPVGLIARRLANEAFALVMAFRHANANTSCLLWKRTLQFTTTEMNKILKKDKTLCRPASGCADGGF